MSIAFHDHLRDVMSCNPVTVNEVIRCGSENRAIVFSASNSAVLNHSSDPSSFTSFNHPCRSLMIAPSCIQLSMLPNSHVSFPPVQTHRSHLPPVEKPSHIHQTTSDALCVCIMLPLTSHPSQPTRSIQLFVKSIRNTTISIHIDSTSSISDLKPSFLLMTVFHLVIYD